MTWNQWESDYALLATIAGHVTPGLGVGPLDD